MSSQPSPGSNDGAPNLRKPTPIEQLHPILLRLIEHMGVIPEGDRSAITETQLAHAVARAIAMMPQDEQAYMVSHILTDDEIAQQRLDSLELQDLEQCVTLSADERRLLLRPSPEPEDGEDGEDGEDNSNGDLCIICYKRSEITIICGCHYCHSCLRASIRSGLRFEINFPPHCCRHFDETIIRLAQRPGLVHIFRQLLAEYSVPANQRLYCHDAGCSSFIPSSAIEATPDDEGDAVAVGTCPLCSKETCSGCRSRSHRGLPCREEGEDEELFLDMMDEEGLVNCPKCGVLIALRDGCNHITCACRQEFCYLCSFAWKTCQCPKYRAFHLLTPTRQRPGVRPIAGSGRAYLSESTRRIPQLRYDANSENRLRVIVDNLVPPDNSALARPATPVQGVRRERPEVPRQQSSQQRHQQMQQLLQQLQQHPQRRQQIQQLIKQLRQHPQRRQQLRQLIHQLSQHQRNQQQQPQQQPQQLPQQLPQPQPSPPFVPQQPLVRNGTRSNMDALPPTLQQPLVSIGTHNNMHALPPRSFVEWPVVYGPPRIVHRPIGYIRPVPHGPAAYLPQQLRVSNAINYEPQTQPLQGMMYSPQLYETQFQQYPVERLQRYWAGNRYVMGADYGPNP